MRNIFIVMESYGSYDSYTCYPVASSLDKQQCDDYVGGMERRKALRDSNKSVIQQHMKTWEEHNPNPGYMDPGLSVWARERYDEENRFKSEILTPDQISDIMNLYDDTVWCIEEIPFLE